MTVVNARPLVPVAITGPTRSEIVAGTGGESAVQVIVPTQAGNLRITLKASGTDKGSTWQVQNPLPTLDRSEIDKLGVPSLASAPTSETPHNHHGSEVDHCEHYLDHDADCDQLGRCSLGGPRTGTCSCPWAHPDSRPRHTAPGNAVSRRRGAVALIVTAATAAILGLSGCTQQPVIPHNRCGGTSSSEGDDKATSATGNTELKASGPITQPTKDGTTTFTSPFGASLGKPNTKGVDFAGPVGTPIYAALDGVAVKAGPASGFGNWIVLDSLVDGKPVSTVYGHMFDDGVLVKEGQQVKAGDHIAKHRKTMANPPAHTCISNTGTAGDYRAEPPSIRCPNSAERPPPPAKPAVILLPSSWPRRHRPSTAAASAWQVAAISKPDPFPPEMEPWFRKAGSICPQIKPSLLAADAKAESGLVRGLTSGSGAQGITQFMPRTFASYGQDDDGNGKTSIWDDGDAIMAQGRYFCAIAAQVDGWIADGSVKGDPKSLYIASYNAGEGAVKNAGGMPSGGDYTTQTQPYVAKVLAYEAEFAAPGGSGELVVSPGVGVRIAGRRRCPPIPRHAVRLGRRQHQRHHRRWIRLLRTDQLRHLQGQREQDHPAQDV